MRYHTNHGLLIEAETSLDRIRRLREASWSEQQLSDQAIMKAVADRAYEQGIQFQRSARIFFVAGCWPPGYSRAKLKACGRMRPGSRSITEETAMGRVVLSCTLNVSLQKKDRAPNKHPLAAVSG
jgi:hypothetical protein